MVSNFINFRLEIEANVKSEGRVRTETREAKHSLIFSCLSPFQLLQLELSRHRNSLS